MGVKGVEWCLKSTMEDHRKERQLSNGTRKIFIEEMAFEMNLTAYVGF